MDLSLSPRHEAFASELRAFLRERLPASIADKVRRGVELSREDHVAWHAILNERGWLAPHWPAENGGTGWDAVQSYLFEVETALAQAPRVVAFGVTMLGPVLIRFGTEEQKARWLPRILDGSDWWCQGFSEPGAGSDLASLKTAAVRDGDHYVVNGQKTWTTLGHFADKIFCLVRTSNEGKKQEGISFLLIDMATPGVEVRPIKLLDGGHEVNEVFFTDVRVPVENLVGEEGRGWTCAKYLLTYERTGTADIGRTIEAMERLKAIARAQTKNGRPLEQDPLFAARLARIEIDLENMKTTNLRIILAAEGGAPLAESSMLKLRGTEIRQEITSLMRRALGPHAQPFVLDEGISREPAYAAPVTPEYLNHRKITIFAGSSEVQRDIIAKAVLGL